MEIVAERNVKTKRNKRKEAEGRCQETTDKYVRSKRTSAEEKETAADLLGEEQERCEAILKQRGNKRR